MGFLDTELKKASKSDPLTFSVDRLHRQECDACPLNHVKGLRHPKMKPAGTKRPVVYMLGEAPGETEDKKGVPFVGKAGRILRMRIPDDWLPDLRWNNCIRTRPPNNRDPSPVELECCRPSIIRDIEETKPVAVFGFGNVPLMWAIKQPGILNWNGRRVPIKVGQHSCWFYPMMHPSYIGRTRRFVPNDSDSYGSDLEFTFAKDLERAFAEVESGTLPDPVVHTAEGAMEGIRWVTGNETGAVKRVCDFLERMADEPMVGLDYETKNLRPYAKDSRLLSAALSNGKETLSFPLDHPQAGWTEVQRERIYNALEEFLYEAKCRKLVHQSAFEMEWSAYHFGKEVIRAGRWGDSVAQAFLLDERTKKAKPDCLSLEFLVLQYFGLNVKEIHNLDRKKDLSLVPLNQLLPYHGLDSKYHILLYQAQSQRFLADKALIPVYAHHMERIPTCVLTQMKGIPVNQKTVNRFYDKYSTILEGLEAKIAKQPEAVKFKQLFNTPFRPSANPDVAKLVRSVLKKPLENTEEESLSKIKNPTITLILEWRKNAKLLSTYIKPLRLGSPHVYKNGTIAHPIISTTRTKTWRTASEDPNSQNFPKRENRHIREQVDPEGKYRVVSFDLGQIQARNVAMESLDKALIKAFWENYDIHADWRDRIDKITHGRWIKGDKHDEKNLKKYRNSSKNEFVFPSFFGAQPKSLARYLGIEISEAEKLHRKFWGEFPEIHDWHERTRHDYLRTGYVTGLSGYRRHAPVSSTELINAPIQADEAMIVLDAMTRLSKKADDAYQANMEIHDDLTFIWHLDDIERHAPTVIGTMIKVPFKWAQVVPIVVEMSVGTNWANVVEVGVYSSVNWDGDLGKKFYDNFQGNWSDGTGWEARKHG